jgi:hypothetical protein
MPRSGSSRTAASSTLPMKARSTVFALLLLVVLACSTLPAGGAAQNEPTVVEVNNQSFLDMTVYAMRSSQRVRLGLATANSKTRFTLPSGLLGGMSTLRFVADPIGSDRNSVSQEITIAPGDTVVMTIPPS